LERDVRGQLWGTVTLTGDLATGWVSVDVIKDGVTLYSGGNIQGLKAKPPAKSQIFNFEIHTDVITESQVIIGSFYSKLLTLPLKDVKVTGQERNSKKPNKILEDTGTSAPDPQD
jgi:hypothetical protein